MSGTIRSLDFFKKSIPAFNIQGKEGEGSLLGSLMTTGLFMVMFLYGSLKFDILVNRVNPTLTVEEKLQEFDD